MQEERALAQMVQSARRVVVLTGAGFSAESGVPTFREAQTGLWARFDPADLATPEAFERDPQRVRDWYAWRRQLVGAASPHAGHRALVDWERRRSLTVVTQNVDGLHQRAGSTDVVELHGNLTRERCGRDCGAVATVPGTSSPPAEQCTACGAPLRPDVVWFGEALPAAALERAMALVSEADLVVTAGTSATVQPAASLPYRALRNRRPVIEVNTETTPFTSDATRHLAGPAATVLPALVAALDQEEHDRNEST